MVRPSIQHLLHAAPRHTLRTPHRISARGQFAVHARKHGARAAAIAAQGAAHDGTGALGRREREAAGGTGDGGSGKGGAGAAGVPCAFADDAAGGAGVGAGNDDVEGGAAGEGGAGGYGVAGRG